MHSVLWVPIVSLAFLAAFFGASGLAADLTVDLSTVCNHTYLSPWPNQEEFGY